MSQSRRVGVVTSAVALIAVGVVVILHLLGIISYGSLRYLWPVLLILFGLEAVLTYALRRQEGIRYSGWSIVLLALIGLLSLGAYSLHDFGSGIDFGPGYAKTVKGNVAIDSDIKHVVIHLRNTPVTITGTPAATLSYSGILKVDAHSKAQADKAIQTEWKVRKEGNTLDLTLTYPRPWIDFSFGGWLTSRPHLDVQVPKRLLTSVTTTNGSIQVTDMNAAIDLHSSNGSLTINHVRGAVVAQSSNGSIQLQNVTSKVNVSTTNGSVHATSMVGSRWNCTTSNGAVSLTLINTPSVKINATTSNGHFGGNIDWNSTTHGVASAEVGGGAQQMYVHTTNGSVSVNVRN